MPSYTFVSTANAFVLRGAKIVFCDSREDHPGMDESQIESLITSKTKAIVPVHYAGVACDMDKIMKLADAYNLYVIEDAAQAIDSYYTFSDGTRKPLGGIGHLGAFSFHETKNIQCGEGGLLIINDPQFNLRAEIIREKGTNRSAFFRGETDKYGWVDIGSSFLPSELNSGFLYAQLESLHQIQEKRKYVWNFYLSHLAPLEKKGIIKLPVIPPFAENNGHMFYVICADANHREQLINKLKKENILSVFHYQGLHKSKFYLNEYKDQSLPFSEHFTDTLLRLPLFYELTENDLSGIVKIINEV